MSENSTVQNLGKAGLQKSSIIIIPAARERSISSCPSLFSQEETPMLLALLILAGKRGFAPQTPEVSDEVTCLTGPEKYVRHGCSMTRKKRGPDSPRDQGTLTSLDSTGVGS